MYRVNLLPRKVLITTDEVIAMAPTDNDPGVRNILLAIQIAEDRFIKPAICKDLYDDFRSAKNVVVTDINKDYLESLFPAGTILEVGSFVNAIELCNSYYQAFWSERLWKLIAECVLYVATPTNWSRYAASGEMVNNPKSIAADSGSGSNSVDLADMKWKMDKMLMDRIDPLVASVQEYLFDNRSSFPYYNCKDFSNCCGDSSTRYDTNGNPVNNSSGISYQRKTAWVHHGFYDRRRRDNCDKGRDY